MDILAATFSILFATFHYQEECDRDHRMNNHAGNRVLHYTSSVLLRNLCMLLRLQCSFTTSQFFSQALVHARVLNGMLNGMLHLILSLDELRLVVLASVVSGWVDDCRLLIGSVLAMLLENLYSEFELIV